MEAEEMSEREHVENELRELIDITLYLENELNAIA
jgi:hypothetical protein